MAEARRLCDISIPSVLAKPLDDLAKDLRSRVTLTD